MINRIFTTLSPLLEDTTALAIIIAFVWGILSVLLSPCHIASIPLIVGYMGSRSGLTTRRAFGISLFFAVGILLTITAVAFITHLAGAMLGDVGPWGDYFVATVFLIFGLVLLDVIKLPYNVSAQNLVKGKGFLSAFVLGLVFGIAVGPCTFAFMAPILANAFVSAHGTAMLVMYGLGHCAIIVIAGTFAEAVQRYMDWNEKSNATNIMRKICGVIIILCGLYMTFKAGE